MSLIDLLPTICDLLDLRCPDNMDGESLKPLIEGEYFKRRLPVLANLSNYRPWDIYCIIQNGYKYIETIRRPNADNVPLRFGVDHPARNQLFDITDDRRETQNLIARYPEIAREMEDSLHFALSRVNKLISDSEKSGGTEIGGSLQKQLEALGYIEN